MGETQAEGWTAYPLLCAPSAAKRNESAAWLEFSKTRHSLISGCQIQIADDFDVTFIKNQIQIFNVFNISFSIFI